MNAHFLKGCLDQFSDEELKKMDVYFRPNDKNQVSCEVYSRMIAVIQDNTMVLQAHIPAISLTDDVTIDSPNRVVIS